MVQQTIQMIAEQSRSTVAEQSRSTVPVGTVGLIAAINLKRIFDYEKFLCIFL